jgi:site-specific DNA-methyltransferase (adenine-specific)
MVGIRSNFWCYLSYSYLIIGASEDKSIVENEYKYIQTRFARFLLMLAVSSINLSSDKFQFIPLQNFTERSDIDWNKVSIRRNAPFTL